MSYKKCYENAIPVCFGSVLQTYSMANLQPADKNWFDSFRILDNWHISLLHNLKVYEHYLCLYMLVFYNTGKDNLIGARFQKNIVV